MSNQTDLFTEPPVYCIDTSSLIALRQSYPIDLFQPIHTQFTELIKSGKIVVLDMVLEELKDKETDTYNFVKGNSPKERLLKFEKYILTTQQIVKTYYDGRGKAHNLKADPHIIACAKEEGLTVVTEELGSEDTKIPFICSQEKVKCINFIDLLRAENIKT